MQTYPFSFGLVLLQAAASSPTPALTPSPASSGSGGFGRFLLLMLGIAIGIVIGLLLYKAFGKSQSKAEEKQVAISGTNATTRVASREMSGAKRCPTCHSTYTDEALIYCVSDGASLVIVKGSPVDDGGATMLNRDLPPTEAYRPNVSIK